MRGACEPPKENPRTSGWGGGQKSQDISMKPFAKDFVKYIAFYLFMRCREFGCNVL